MRSLLCAAAGPAAPSLRVEVAPRSPQRPRTKSVRTVSTIAMLAVCALPCAAAELPGQPLGSADYVLGFYPDGYAFYLSYDPLTGASSNYVQDNGVWSLTSNGLVPFLSFKLPEPVATGDVALAGRNGKIEAGLRFVDLAGVYAMELFPNAMFPANFSFSFVVEFATAPLNYVFYAPGAVSPYSMPAIFYEGVARVPELSTWVMMALGFAGLSLVSFNPRRRLVFREGPSARP
jgi:hypothetical protein